MYEDHEGYFGVLVRIQIVQYSDAELPYAIQFVWTTQ